jgi:dihydroorotate dehydrogenase (fumarate)
MSAPDLSTSYLGLTLANPLVLAASPYTKRVENAIAVAEAGIGAIVMHSIFEEEYLHAEAELDQTLSRGVDSFAEATSYLPETGVEAPSPRRYAQLLSSIKQAVGVPVIGSINGSSEGGWLDYAEMIQDAGADALELNVYYLAAGASSAAEVEDTYLKLVTAVRRRVKIPLAVKIGPFFTALPAFSQRLVAAGADGLVLFNRFYQPDIDIDTLSVVPKLNFSTSDDLRLPLRWAAILSPQLKADISISGGVHSHQDVLKSLLVGASATQLAAELLQMGPSRIPLLLKDLEAWLTEHEYDSVAQLQGSMSAASVEDPTAFERSNYLKALRSYDDRLP